MVKGSKNKIKWVLTNAWQSDSILVVQFPILSSQKLRNQSPACFVNKVLLEHSCAHSLTYCPLLHLC